MISMSKGTKQKNCFILYDVLRLIQKDSQTNNQANGTSVQNLGESTINRVFFLGWKW